MKKTKRILSVIGSLIMIMSFYTTAFAAGTVENVRNPDGVGDIISISNVKMYGGMMKVEGIYYAKPVYICYAPATVTNLIQNPYYSVYKIKDDNLKEYLDVDGKVRARNVKTDEYIIVSIEEAKKNPDLDFGGALPDAKITITEPGIYVVRAGIRDPNINYDGEVAFIIIEDNADESSAYAKATSSKVKVDGKQISFDAYNINGSNYFKLRDIAKVLSLSDSKFDVEWNNDKKAISLVSGKSYTEVGGEMLKGDGYSRTAVTCTSKIYKDNKEISLTGYTINGNNYFKLRELGELLDFSVNWDQNNDTVIIETTSSTNTLPDNLDNINDNEKEIPKLDYQYEDAMTKAGIPEYQKELIRGIVIREGKTFEEAVKTIYPDAIIYEEKYK